MVQQPAEESGSRQMAPQRGEGAGATRQLPIGSADVQSRQRALAAEIGAQIRRRTGRRIDPDDGIRPDLPPVQRDLARTDGTFTVEVDGQRGRRFDRHEMEYMQNWSHLEFRCRLTVLIYLLIGVKAYSLQER